MALVASVPLMAQSSDGEIKPIVVQVNANDAHPIVVRSSNAQLQALLSKAFSLHGAFRVVSSEGGADFVFRIEPAGDNAVTLEILTGSPAKSIFTSTVNGSSLDDAALRAADLAVTKTTLLKGFFAGSIAFIGERGGMVDLYYGDLFFQHVKQLSHDGVQCVHPTIATDGRTILYTSFFHNGFPDIFKVDVASGSRETFLSFNGTNTSPRYSPNGSRVAVVLSGTGNAELYTVSAAGRDMVRLTKDKSLESDPAWSPDGSRIVFACDEPGKPQLYQISANGGAISRLQTNVSNYCTEPTWNPVNANQIAFTVTIGKGFQIALFEIGSGKAAGTISSGSADAIEPVWLSDGRHLIYTERTPNHRRLVVLDSKTGHKAYLSSESWGDVSQADFLYR